MRTFEFRRLLTLMQQYRPNTVGYVVAAVLALQALPVAGISAFSYTVVRGLQQNGEQVSATVKSLEIKRLERPSLFTSLKRYIVTYEFDASVPAAYIEADQALNGILDTLEALPEEKRAELEEAVGPIPERPTYDIDEKFIYEQSVAISAAAYRDLRQGGVVAILYDASNPAISVSDPKHVTTTMMIAILKSLAFLFIAVVLVRPPWRHRKR